MAWYYFTFSQYAHMAIVALISTTAREMHSASHLLLIRQLAFQSASSSSRESDDDAFNVLFVRWNTVILVVSALASAVLIPIYSMKASQFGKRRLMILGIGSTSIQEVGYYYVARQSFQCVEDASRCNSRLYFEILIGMATFEGVFGGYQLITLIARMIVIDQSTIETRASKVLYLQAIYMAASIAGPAIATLSSSIQINFNLNQSSSLRQNYSTIFFVAAALYTLSLFYAMIFFKKDGDHHLNQRQASEIGFLKQLKKVALFEPRKEGSHSFKRLLPPLRKLPIIKSIICAMLTIDGASIYSFMIQFADIRFDWKIRDNSLFLGLSSVSRFIVVLFLIPITIKGVFKLLYSRLTASSNRLQDDSEERQLLLPPQEQDSIESIFHSSLSKYASPEIWIVLLSYITNTIGWSLAAFSTLSGSVELLCLGAFFQTLGGGGYVTLQAFTYNLFEKGQAARIQGEEDQTETILNAYLGVSGMLENIMSLLTPMLDGLIFSTTLTSAPYVIFLWTALQYGSCCIIILLFL